MREESAKELEKEIATRPGQFPSITGFFSCLMKRYNRGLAVDQQALGQREASEHSRIKRDNS